MALDKATNILEFFKKHLFLAGLLILVGSGLAFAMSDKPETYSWRYKMTVTVDTPEGEVSGSAVREMGNGPMSPPSQNGNPANVRGEAVVVDMGKRGVLFALISHKSDEEFYYTFRKYHFDGPATLEGSKTFASLPSGTKEVINPEKPSGYPKLVTFTDMNDPKSVTEAQVWDSEFKTGLYFLKEDRMEKLFGKGVHLKDIAIEITDEPVTWGVVDRYLPKGFEDVLIKNWKNLSKSDRQRLVDIVTFKQGEPK